MTIVTNIHEIIYLRIANFSANTNALIRAATIPSSQPESKIVFIAFFFQTFIQSFRIFAVMHFHDGGAVVRG